jgi:hypothetical protein
MYSSLKIHLPWKRWLELAWKCLCIIGWVDGVMLPGPDFDIKKLGAGDVHEISGSYVDNILNGTNNYQAFSVVHWSAGVWYLLPSQ